MKGSDNLKVMKQNICDYKGYDYKEEFWVKQNRKYEHKLS